MQINKLTINHKTEFIPFTKKIDQFDMKNSLNI